MIPSAPPSKNPATYVNTATKHSPIAPYLKNYPKNHHYVVCRAKHHEREIQSKEAPASNHYASTQKKYQHCHTVQPRETLIGQRIAQSDNGSPIGRIGRTAGKIPLPH